MQPHRQKLTVAPEALFLVSATAQYGGAVVAVRLFDDLSPATVAWLRVLFAGLILVSASSVVRSTQQRSQQQSQRPTRRPTQWRAVALFGTSIALMNLFFFLAIDRLPLGKGVAIEFIGPILVAAYRTRSRRNWLALAVAVIGVAVLSGVELGQEPLGVALILMASAMWAAYIVLGSRVALDSGGVLGLGLGLLIGAAVISPVGISDLGTAVSTPSLLAACALVGLLSNAIGYGIDQLTLRTIPVRRFSVLLALLPVTAAVFGMIFLGQVPTTIDVVGIGLVLLGVAIQERDIIERHHETAATT